MDEAERRNRDEPIYGRRVGECCGCEIGGRAYSILLEVLWASET